ncbi:hypothetical protein Tco_0822224 [Tanacetum coccineum]|uniref:Uncharacterized protein n=1 Tax=Tanacetum coccineum TaxID=301880 RepID=A0ABQ5AEG7_9ASTR
MSTSNQQTLAESEATDRPPILEKGNYIPWERPYVRPMIPDPDDPRNQIPEPLSKMTKANRKCYSNDVRVVNYLLQTIPNDSYNSVDACKDAQKLWERIRREGESLDSVYERLSTHVNVMDRNDVHLSDIEYDSLYDTLLQFEPHVQASKAKKAAKNHDPLALIAYSNAYSSQSHASPSYSHSSQPYYVTHPSSVVDSEEDYQRELQGDVQEDKLTTAMMLLAREIIQKLSTPTNNRLCTSLNTRNQAMINDGRVDIQTKNAGYGGNGNRNEGRQNRNQASNAGNGLMLLAIKDEAGGTLNEEENDSMLDNAYGDETLEELTVLVIMMAHIQPADENTKTEPKYDAEAVTEVNASDAVVVRLQQEVLQLPR